MYRVFAFYPHFPLKVRVTEYTNKTEMYEYIGGLRLCDTAYLAIDKNLKPIDMMTTPECDRETMATLIMTVE